MSELTFELAQDRRHFAGLDLAWAEDLEFERLATLEAGTLTFPEALAELSDPHQQATLAALETKVIEAARLVKGTAQGARHEAELALAVLTASGLILGVIGNAAHIRAERHLEALKQKQQENQGANP
jgi:hypothetical protein